MKFASVIATAIVSAKASDPAWEAYKNEFNKVYNGNSDDEYRRRVFEQNLVAQAELNAREPLAHYGPTVFSDMTSEEFEAAYLGGITPSNITLLEEVGVNASLEVPAAQDWTSKYTTAVKDQGTCGSCWAFSASQQVESDAMREHGWTGTLSVQELVDCTSDGEGSQRKGCKGGFTHAAYETLQALGGSVSEEDYKYRAHNGKCGHINNLKKQVTVKSWKSVGIGSASTMKAYIGSTGPLSVGVVASEWKDYISGIKTSCRYAIGRNHYVQIVGYGSDGSTDYWKVRNSWGTQFGENGYIRLKIGSNTHNNLGLCNINIDPTATLTGVTAVVV